MPIPPIPTTPTTGDFAGTISAAGIMTALQQVGIDGDDIVRVCIDITKIVVERQTFGPGGTVVPSVQYFVLTQDTPPDSSVREPVEPVPVLPDGALYTTSTGGQHLSVNDSGRHRARRALQDAFNA